jgi:hypothetical protein
MPNRYDHSIAKGSHHTILHSALWQVCLFSLASLVHTCLGKGKLSYWRPWNCKASSCKNLPYDWKKVQNTLPHQVVELTTKLSYFTKTPCIFEVSFQYSFKVKKLCMQGTCTAFDSYTSRKGKNWVWSWSPALKRKIHQHNPCCTKLRFRV